MTTIRGPKWVRITTALTFWTLTIFAVVTLVGDLRQGTEGGWILTNLALGTFSSILGVRALGARIELLEEVLVLHGLVRTRRIPWGLVRRTVEGSFLGRQSNFVELVSGRRILLPLPSQVSDPRFLRETRSLIEQGRPPTTPS